MLDERFSADAFEEAGLDTPAARELADLLEQEVQDALDAAIQRVMLDVVSRLNDMGHDLRPEVSSRPGEMTFFDNDPASSDWHQNTKLRLAVDSTVSAGYRHFTEPK